MQFTSITLAAIALFSSALAAPNDLVERSAGAKIAMMEERAAYHGTGPLFPDSSALTKRDCDCAAFTSCNAGCGAFNNGAGQGGGFCTSSCYSSSGCSQNTLCCTDGHACEGSGCCA